MGRWSAKICVRNIPWRATTPFSACSSRVTSSAPTIRNRAHHVVGWSGVIVNGCIRDSHAIDAMPIAVRALGTHPRKTVKRGWGERDVAEALRNLGHEGRDL
ncbi:hypothetical protein B4Q13_25420, partial [Lacticaseibacillus rhamnosus]